MEQHQDAIEETNNEDDKEKLRENKAKEQEENSQQNLDDASAEKSETEQDTVANGKQEDAEDTSLQPVCVDNVDNKTSEILAGPADTPAASPEGEKLDNTSAEKDQELKSVKEDESSESCPNKKDNESIVPDDAEAVATAVGETLEMRAEPSKGQEALDLEEAPVDEEEGRQTGESEDGATAENTGETTAAATDVTNEQKMEISENIDGGLIMEVVVEENTQENNSEEEEKSRESVEIDQEKENKSEDIIQEQDSPIKSQELTDMNVEQKEEVVENVKDVSKLNGSDPVMEDRTGEPAEKTSSENNKDTGAGEAQESEDTKKDEDGERITAENKVDEGEKADEEQRDKGEQEKKDQTQTEVESGKVATGGMAEEESEKSAETLNHGVENIEEESEAVNTTSEATVETLTGVAGAPTEKDVEVDGENGEFSVSAQNETHDDPVEPPAGGEVEVNRARNAEDEVHAEESAPVEPTDRRETTGDGTDKRSGDEVELPSLADVLETMATEEDKNDRKQEGSVVSKLEVEKSDGEIKEEEAKQDENGNVSEPGGEKQNSDAINQDNDAESNVTGLRDALSESPGAAGSGEDPSKFKELLEMHEADKRLNADTIAADLPTSKGETEEVEEASKTSEEGASVLVKPQAQSSPSKDERVATVIVANEDNVDLVSNWVNTHQVSRFFETFVEPLDDLKEADAQESHINPSGERSASPVKKVTELGGLTKATTEESAGSELESSRSKDKGESDPVEDLPQVQGEQQEADIMPEGDTDGQQNGQELVEDLLKEEPEKADEMQKSDNDKAPTDKDLVEDLLQMQEELDEADLMPGRHKEGQTNAKDIAEELLEEQEEPQKNDLLPEADNDGAATEKDLAGDPLQAQEEPEKADEVQEGDMDADMMSEEPSGSRMSRQEHTDPSKTEVESIAGTQRSITSITSESVSRLQTDKKITESTTDLRLMQRPVELPDSGLVPETKEHEGWPSTSDNLLEMKQSALTDIQDIFKPSEGVMEISDLTAERNHEETHQNHRDQTQSQMPGEGIVRDVRLIEDIQRSLSKDRLSPFTVDGTLLGQNSHPLLSAVRTESKH